MNRSVRIHEAAASELYDAVEFYNHERSGLGDDFINEIEYAISNIAAYPNAPPSISGGLRKKTIERFPFSIIYAVRAYEIRILAIAHQKRRPSYWRYRR